MSEQPLTATERLLPPHLGGHFGQVNKDPAVLRYLAARYGIGSMLDVGCGPGGMLDEAIALGVLAAGVDGDPYVCEADRRIILHDYTTGPLVIPVELIWCTEFVEHVEEAYLGNVLATFSEPHVRVLYLTAAPPGFPGWHHVNCQPESYWIKLLTERGWGLDVEATLWVRHNGDHVFSRRQGLVFVKDEQNQWKLRSQTARSLLQL
jgi:SAM-dependent methyltransferase